MIRIAYAEDDQATAEMLKQYITRYAEKNALEIETEHFINAERLIYN